MSTIKLVDAPFTGAVLAADGTVTLTGTVETELLTSDRPDVAMNEAWQACGAGSVALMEIAKASVEAMDEEECKAFAHWVAGFAAGWSK